MFFQKKLAITFVTLLFKSDSQFFMLKKHFAGGNRPKKRLAIKLKSSAITQSAKMLEFPEIIYSKYET